MYIVPTWNIRSPGLILCRAIRVPCTQKYLINVVSSINSNNVYSGPVVESVFPLVFSFIHRAQQDYRRGGVAICSRSSLEYGIMPWSKIKYFEHLG